MSFVQEEDIQDVVEVMICAVFAEALGIDVGRPFPRMTYAEAMRRFGSDKPDMRFAMEIVDVSDLAAGSEFRVFSETLASGGVVLSLIHISEPTRLLSISYAVFCLKKKKN